MTNFGPVWYHAGLRRTGERHLVEQCAHLDEVLAVVPVASRALCDPVVRFVAPCALMLHRVEACDRHAFAVVGGERLEVYEAGHGACQLLDARCHLVVLLDRLGPES